MRTDVPLGRFLASMLMALAAVILLPGDALAAGPTALTVNGTAAVVDGETVADSGTNWSYDENTGTLTLSGANLSTIDESNYTVIYATGGDLNLLLSGSNTITASATGNAGADGIYGVRIAEGNLAVLGAGSLTVDSDDYGLYAASGDIRIGGGNVTMLADGCGVYAAGTVTIDGGSVSATGDRGVSAASGVAIHNGVVSVTGTTDGIHSQSKVTITGGSVEAAVSGSDASAISGSTVTISGGNTVAESGGSAISAGTAFAVSGGTVIAHGGSYGVSATSASVTGGNVVLTGDSSSVNSSVTVQGVTAYNRETLTTALYSDGTTYESNSTISSPEKALVLSGSSDLTFSSTSGDRLTSGDALALDAALDSSVNAGGLVVAVTYDPSLLSWNDPTWTENGKVQKSNPVGTGGAWDTVLLSYVADMNSPSLTELLTANFTVKQLNGTTAAAPVLVTVVDAVNPDGEPIAETAGQGALYTILAETVPAITNWQILSSNTLQLTIGNLCSQAAAEDYSLYRWTAGSDVTDISAAALVCQELTTQADGTVTMTDETVQAGVDYVYRVQLQYGDQLGSLTGTLSEQVEASIPLLPTPQITNSSTNATEPSVTITWDAVEGADGYVVYRRGTSGSWSALNADGTTETSYTDTTVQLGASYYYAVCAYVTAGDVKLLGELKGEGVSVNVPVMAAPTWAENGEPTLDGGPEVNLSWNDAGAASYQVYRLENGQNETLLTEISADGATAYSYTDSGLTCGSTYTYKIYAVTSNGGVSEALVGSIEVPATLAAVTDLELVELVDMGDTLKATFTWTGTGADTYIVSWTQTNNPLTSTDSTCTITDLQPNAEYRLSVNAVIQIDGQSINGETAELTFDTYFQADVLHDDSYTTDGVQVFHGYQLTWAEEAYDGYLVYRDGEQIANVTDNSYADTAASANGHRYAIKGYTVTDGLYVYGTERTLTLPTPAHTPVTLTVAGTVDEPVAQLNVGSPVYLWYQPTGGTARLVLLETTQNDSSYTAPIGNLLTPGKTYSLRAVVPVDDVIYLDFASETQTYTYTGEATAPVITGFSLANNSGTALTLTWEGNYDSYTIYQDGQQKASVSGSVNQCTIGGLTAGVSYEFTVHGDYLEGDSYTSGLTSAAQTCVIPTADQLAAANFTATEETGNVILNWDAITGYPFPVYYELSRTENVLYDGTDNTYTDKTVIPGTYTYTLRAYLLCNDGTRYDGSAINSNAVTVGGIGSEVSVTGLETVTYSPTQIQLSWDSLEGADGYQVQLGGSVSYVESNSWMHQDAAQGVAYTYTVQAYTGNQTLVGQAATISYTIPTLNIENLTVDEDASSLTTAVLTWTEMADAETYQITCNGADCTDWTLESKDGKVYATLKNLPYETGADSVVRQNFTVTACMTTEDGSTLTSQTGGNVARTISLETSEATLRVIGANTMQVEWDAVSWATAYRVTWQKVTLNNAGEVESGKETELGTVSAVSGNQSLNHTDAEQNQDYLYRVYGVCEEYTSLVAQGIFRIETPAAVKNVTATVTDGAVELAWYTETYACHGFQIDIQKDGETVWTAQVEIGDEHLTTTLDNATNRLDCTYLLEGQLTPGTEYTAVVQGYYQPEGDAPAYYGESAVSNAFITTVAAPRNVTAIRTGVTQVTITWEEVFGAVGYSVYRDGERLAQLPGGDTLRYVDETAELNNNAATTYTYSIAAYSGSDSTEGTASAPVSVTMTPLAGSVNLSGEGKLGPVVLLRWTAEGVEDINGYEIWRSDLVDGSWQEAVQVGVCIAAGGNSYSYTDYDVTARAAYRYLVRPYHQSSSDVRVYGTDSNSVEVTAGYGVIQGITLSAETNTMKPGASQALVLEYETTGTLTPDLVVTWNVDNSLATVQEVNGEYVLMADDSVEGKKMVTMTASVNDGSNTVESNPLTIEINGTVRVAIDKKDCTDDVLALAGGSSYAFAIDEENSYFGTGETKLIWSVITNNPDVKLDVNGRLTTEAVTEEETLTVKAELQDSSGTVLVYDTVTVHLQGKGTGVRLYLLNEAGESVYVDEDGTALPVASNDKKNVVIPWDIADAQTLQLKAKMDGNDVSLFTWTSSSDKIAKVSRDGVTLNGVGTATITATATDGSKTSASFKLQVYYITPATKLVVTSNAPSYGLAEGQSAQLTVTADGVKLDNSLLDFDVKSGAVSVDENGVVTVNQSGGSDTITVTLKDDDYTSRKGTVTIKTIDAQNTGFTLGTTGADCVNGQVHLKTGENNQSFTITPSVAAKYTVKSSNSKVAKVSVKDKDTGFTEVTIPKNASGTAVITFTSKDKAKATAALTVTVTDDTPVLGSYQLTLNAKRINDDGKPYVTTTITNGDRIAAPAVFNYNKSTKTYTENTNYQAEVSGNLLTLTCLGTPEKGTVYLKAVIDGETYYTKAITLSVASAAPSITVKQTAKLNLSYCDSVAVFTLTAKDGTEITDVELDKASAAYFEKVSYRNGVLTLRRTAGDIEDNGAKLGLKKVGLKLSLDGYSTTVPATASVGTTSTKQNLVLSSTTGTFTTDKPGRAVILTVSTKGTKANPGAQLMLSDGYTVTDDADFAEASIQTNNKLVLKLDDDIDKGGKVNLYVQHENWTAPVKLTYTVKLQDRDALTAKLKTTTLKLSSTFWEGTSATTAITFSQNNVSLKALGQGSTIEPKNGEDTGLFKWTLDTQRNTLTVTYVGGEAKLPAKSTTYSFILTLKTEDNQLNPMTVKVKMAPEKPTVKFAPTSLSLNASLRGSETASARMTVSVAGYEIAELGEVMYPSNLIGNEFDFQLDAASQRLIVQLRDGAEVANGSYKFSFYPTIQGNDTQLTAAKAVTLTVKVYHNTAYSATVKASGKLSATNGGSITYTLTKLTNITGTVENVWLAGEHGEYFEAEFSGTNAKGQPIVVLSAKDGTPAGKYSVILQFGLEGLEQIVSTKVLNVTVGK